MKLKCLKAIAIYSGCILWLLTAGCDLSWLSFTNTGFVKSQTSQYANAIGEAEWDKVSQYHDGKFTWEQGKRKLRGKAGTQAFIKSIQEIKNMDGMFIEIVGVDKSKPDQIALDAFFQAHVVLNSMTMTFSNFMWKGRILWVKRGEGECKIAYIQELSERKVAKRS